MYYKTTDTVIEAKELIDGLLDDLTHGQSDLRSPEEKRISESLEADGAYLLQAIFDNVIVLFMVLNPRDIDKKLLIIVYGLDDEHPLLTKNKHIKYRIKLTDEDNNTMFYRESKQNSNTVREKTFELLSIQYAKEWKNSIASTDSFVDNSVTF